MYALIMGSSGDIGASTAKNLANKGWSLYLHYNKNRERIDHLYQELRNQYPHQDFIPVQYDMEKDHVDKLTSQIFGLDAIIFAQGNTYYKLLVDMDEQELDSLWNIHIKQPILILKELQDKLATKHHGRIVFIGSIYGKIGSAMEVVYSTVKGAMSSFADAYAKEVASLGISVNVVAPGAVDTKMNNEFSSQDLEAVREEIPANRLANSDEIADLVGYLVQIKSNYLTGQTIYFAGGWLL
ncbi:elongation factor P 5-aminopentanone reductase [Companilactobacillus sp.]|uniref:elongation factor P 5-aminopentanone reductase n=1 Tax=Companilactobacillus sp. TaxID=2767905 RepID=UPI0025B93EE6|nr:SDR family NAD(P)-dependent oxidoreductase [Companilactobacillus sp.]MCH4008814.1 SDR family NAD(P)-dependent oxidoreductase [Companilactobacillus sp.]MCH4051007.1 SDR family NAD(P)-dependent oxidoreductase [Companilactobacillus sp.]MCH4076757.1 SDR family NAD(P)-dependent oxidoreductase [Companilactobacillus sp.]MCH4125332.1 SDR family NAD(P)-dependent oxidoreductase [Companilactobacillus sp.]MCH4131872.1 SDR family NAD(P)-dependent oxidoreductase [Companilactobacillus sp.]